MNVLSLFDGMSCGQIALERAGIPVDNYFASEINKYAMQVTQTNYPNTIQLGDVTKVVASKLPKIDLLIGGSPCQGFSFAGKQLNFEDPRSMLFFEYVRLLEELKPKHFLLENVKMKKEFQDVITNLVGVEPIEINSALVSAQNRKRLYWTNLPIQFPIADRKIYLKDILENGSVIADKSQTILSTMWKENAKSMVTRKKKGLLVKLGEIGAGGQGNRVYSIEGKGICMSANSGGMAGSGNMLIQTGDRVRKLSPVECERLQTIPDSYTEGISKTQRYKMLGNGWTVDVIAHIFKGC